MEQLKSEKVAVLLAALLGAIGFLGIGHLYVGRIRRGLILLIGTWGLVSISVMCLFAWSMSHMIIPPPGQPIGTPPAGRWVFLVVSLLFSLGAIALWIWQIIDARAVCRDNNKLNCGVTHS
ncbi:hypothetical protein ACFLU4_03365 [Chloroflexota bacterium]